jgi:F-type H+-transporting ATPase subunit epsilon
MTEHMRVVVLTPNKRLLDVSGVSELYFPTDSGTIGVLPGHAPLITVVGTGSLIYTQENVSGIFSIAGGVADVSGYLVTLMVDIAEEASQIDLERAQRALERAQARLAAKELSNIDVKRAEAALQRAEARIASAQMKDSTSVSAATNHNNP